MTNSGPRNVFEWSKAYFRNEDRKLHETRSTMATLMTYADFDTLTCYPSQRTLARDTGVSVDSIRRHIKKNVDAGWLNILEAGSSYKSNTRYRLSTPSTCALSARMPPGADATRPLAPMSPTPSTAAGSTPSTGAALTIHVPTHGTNHESTQGNVSRSQPSDPFGSEGVYRSHPTRPSTTAPCADARSRIIDPFAD